MGRYKVFVAFLLFITQFTIVTNLYASTANTIIGDWTVTSKTPSGIGQAISATKSVMLGGKEIIKTSSAVIAPKAADVGKFLARNGAAAAVVGALDLILDGADYVMDPENNTVKKKISSGVQTNSDFTDNTTSLTGDDLCFKVATNGGFSPRKDLACYLSYYGTNSAGQKCFTASFFRSSTSFESWTSCFSDATYNPPEDQYESIPISTIASDLITQAEDDIRIGNPSSPAVALSRVVAGEIIEDAKSDVKSPAATHVIGELEKSASYDTVGTAEGTIDTPAVVDPVTGEVVTPSKVSDLSLEFPAFCGWAPVVCEAAQVVLDAPAKVLQWVEAVKEWVKEKDETDNELDIPEIDDQNTDFDLNVSGSCPANIVFIDTVFMGMPYKIEMEYPQLCNILSTYVKPILIVMGSFYALLIIAGVRANG